MNALTKRISWRTEYDLLGPEHYVLRIEMVSTQNDEYLGCAIASRWGKELSVLYVEVAPWLRGLNLAWKTLHRLLYHECTQHGVQSAAVNPEAEWTPEGIKLFERVKSRDERLRRKEPQ